MMDLAGRHLANRLHVELESVLLYGLAYSMRPIDALAQFVTVLVRRVIDMHQVASAVLGDEARLVGLDEVFLAGDLAAVDEADADAATDRGAAQMTAIVIVIEHFDQTVGHLHRLLRIGGDEFAMLLTNADAAQQIRVARARGEQFR